MNSRAEALKTNDQDFKKEVLEASKVLDAGLKCAMCGRAGFGSVEELGDHAAECFGEPIANDAMTGDDDAAVLAEMLRTRDLEEEVVPAAHEHEDGALVVGGVPARSIPLESRPNSLKINKETTHVIVTWTRVVWK